MESSKMRAWDYVQMYHALLVEIFTNYGEKTI